MKKYSIHAILGAVVILLALTAYLQMGLSGISLGLLRGLTILVRELPLLTAAFLTAGLLQVLIKKEWITRWLGSQSGWKGILIACLSGGLIPGGPYAYYPIAGTLLKQGAGLGVLVSFVTAKNLWSISRLPLEIAILGTYLTTRRYLITFLIPPLIGFLTEILFGRWIHAVRENA